jgi:hypothetical protein
MWQNTNPQGSLWRSISTLQASHPTRKRRSAMQSFNRAFRGKSEQNCSRGTFSQVAEFVKKSLRHKGLLCCCAVVLL